MIGLFFASCTAPKTLKVPKAYLGLLHCGECNMMITAEIKQKYYKTKNRHASYTYYRCTKKSKLQKCSQPFVREEKLDSQLSSEIQKVSLPKDWAKKMLRKLAGEKQNTAMSSFAFENEKRKEIDGIKQKLQFLLDSFLDQVIDRETYLLKKNELVSQKKTLEEQMIRFSQKQNSWLEPFGNWIVEASNVDKIAKDTNLFEKKALALKIFGSNLTLKDKKVGGEALSPWAALRAAPPSRKWELYLRTTSNYF